MHHVKSALFLIFAFVVLCYGCLWLFSLKTYPIEFGISFSKQHAEYLGLDWKQTYLAILDELKPKYIRISANWSDVEKQPGQFDFSDADWQMLEAGKRKVGVMLVAGQKAPRWPECHVPEWANKLTKDKYQVVVKSYMKEVVERYKNHPALDMWQVENEPFIDFKFGNCVRFDEGLVREEIDLVRSLDIKHKIMVTDSGEMGWWRKAGQAGDILGTTVYRVVMTPQGWYWRYGWLPASVYRIKAALIGRNASNFFISELQAEPWFTKADPKDVSIKEQEKSMSPSRLENNINYAKRIGASRAYLWGAEWWYWMKEKNNDSRYWEIVGEAVSCKSCK